MGSVSTFLSFSLPYLASTKLPFTEPEFYVWAFCAGFNVAMIFAFAVKSVESKFVNKLFEMEAFDSGRAITILQAGVKSSSLLRFLLREKSTLRNVILLADDKIQNVAVVTAGGEGAKDGKIEGDEKAGSKEKIDFDKAKFYINEQKLDRATSLKKGAIKWYLLPVFCAVSICLAIGVCYLLPIILNW